MSDFEKHHISDPLKTPTDPLKPHTRHQEWGYVTRMEPGPSVFTISRNRDGLTDSAGDPIPTPSISGEDHSPLLQHDDIISSASLNLQDAKLTFAMRASWAANLALFVAKIYVFIASGSMAVLASTADSFVDLASQGVISWAEHRVRHRDVRFPVGKTRLEAIGVMGCAVIMSISTLEVIRSSGETLFDGFFRGVLPDLHLSMAMYVILGLGSLAKIILYFLCTALKQTSDSMLALAEDHCNDVASNLTAIATATFAIMVPKVWWIDAMGAILISMYIIYSWAIISKTQVDKLVGRAAPEEFVGELEMLASTHHDELEIDVIRAYHFGPRFIVEMEVVMPEGMTVRASHDIALILQHKVEELEAVERCFVHVDYEKRSEPEHKVERVLLKKEAHLAAAAAEGPRERSISAAISQAAARQRPNDESV
ncbi:hypothetical protein WJX84_004692 [Apatococcus fuscideae]|uniref:Cation efflux protein cytoplasmic domain-containing protein n=1 Tax=Apatococcus fuscideae TaxID=2026836 RepID=A0AAW1SX76_9CHLO